MVKLERARVDCNDPSRVRAVNPLVPSQKELVEDGQMRAEVPMRQGQSCAEIRVVTRRVGTNAESRNLSRLFFSPGARLHEEREVRLVEGV